MMPDKIERRPTGLGQYPKDVVEITTRQILIMREHTNPENGIPIEMVLKRRFTDFMVTCREVGLYRDFRGVQNGDNLERWRNTERNLFEVFMSELERAGAIFPAETKASAWELYQGPSQINE